MALALVSVNSDAVVVTVSGSELLAPFLTTASGHASAAAASAATATAKAAAATVSADAAAASVSSVYNAMLAALAAGTLVGPYATKAAADAAALAGTLAANAFAHVIVDETQGSAPTVRQRVGSATTTTFVAALGGLAASFTTTQPASGASTYAKDILTMPAPASGMLSDLPRNDAVNAKVYVNASKTNNGPVGEVNYWNTVAGFCLNSDASFVPLNAAMPAGSFRIESKFYQSACFGTEFHISQGHAANEFRAFTAFVPHVTTDWAEKSGSDIRGAKVQYIDGAGTLRVQYNLEVSSGAGTIALFGVGANNLRLLFDKNNSPFLQQINAAASAYINLPYFDSRDVLRLTNASYHVTNAPAAGVNTATGYSREHLELGAETNGGFEYVLVNNAITGNFFGYHIDAISVSGNYVFTNTRNAHATGKLIDRRVAEGDIIFATRNDGGSNPVNFGRRASDGAAVIACGTADSLANPGIEIANATRYVNLPAGRLNISGTKVLGTQGAAIANATDAATAISQLNLLLAAARTHGLIAT